MDSSSSLVWSAAVVDQCPFLHFCREAVSLFSSSLSFQAPKNSKSTESTFKGLPSFKIGSRDKFVSWQICSLVVRGPCKTSSVVLEEAHLNPQIPVRGITDGPVVVRPPTYFPRLADLGQVCSLQDHRPHSRHLPDCSERS
jgi:hypothetical protein